MNDIIGKHTALRVSYENTADKILLSIGKIRRAVYEASVMKTDYVTV